MEPPTYAENAFKVVALFPKTNNDGMPFDKDVWSWWRDRLIMLQFNYSRTGDVFGVWKGQSDTSVAIYWVVRTHKEVDRIWNFVREAGVKFEQKEMYFEISSIYFDF